MRRARWLPGVQSPLVAHRGGFGARLASLALTGVGLALALDARRLVVLAALRLREQAVLLYLAGELLEGLVERLALFDQNLSHSCFCYLDGDTDLTSSLLSSRSLFATPLSWAGACALRKSGAATPSIT